ncbi:MAG: DNA repair protein RecO [Verrucomicrobia bacterium]|nr:DNA repair protein RecO [Verrucomicrobiota bacterium]MDE3098230.1 DNA repair protein RecO [Verrucomicrobiota bacterium]
MIESACGIILRLRPLTETSLIVQWLTSDSGRLATVARGARRPKSPFLGRLDLFYEAEMSFSRSRRSDLHTLREVRLRQTRPAIRGDLARLRRAAYACALVEQTTETETPLPGIFGLMRNFLDALCGQESGPQRVIAFELDILRELGLQPDWKQARLTEATRQSLSARPGPDAGLKLASPQFEEVRRFLHGFLIYHLGRLPKGRAAALAE